MSDWIYMSDLLRLQDFFEIVGIKYTVEDINSNDNLPKDLWDKGVRGTITTSNILCSQVVVTYYFDKNEDFVDWAVFD